MQHKSILILSIIFKYSLLIILVLNIHPYTIISLKVKVLQVNNTSNALPVRAVTPRGTHLRGP